MPADSTHDTPAQATEGSAQLIGELSGGIAHQLSTPVQLVAANLQFLSRAWAVLSSPQLKEDSVGGASMDPDFARAEAPAAIQQSLMAMEQMAELLRTMKEWSEPGDGTRALLDPCDVLRRVVRVTEHRFRYTHELRLTLGPASEMRCHRQHLVATLAQVIAWLTDAEASETEGDASDALCVVELSGEPQGDQFLVQARRRSQSGPRGVTHESVLARFAQQLGGSCSMRTLEDGTVLLSLRIPLCA